MSNGLKWNTTQVNANDPDGEPEGEVSNPNDIVNHSSLTVVAKQGMRILQTHFPGHLWALQINQFGRVINVFNHALHDEWGYLIKLDEVEHRRTVGQMFLEAGGQILERFGLKPGRFDIAEYVKLKKDAKGRCLVVYLSDLECAAAKKLIQKRKLDQAILDGRYTEHNGRVLVAV